MLPSRSIIRHLRLSRRQKEVLDLLARGWSNRQVAAALSISPQTAKAHVMLILDKLDVPNRGAAVARARELGLLPAEAGAGDGQPHQDSPAFQTGQ